MFSRLSQLGIETVGVYGVFFPLPEGFSKTKAMDQAIRYANAMADCAAPLNMRIALEPMANPHTLWPSYLDGIAFAKEVKRPEVKVMADLAYLLKLNEPCEDIAKEPEYCLHCHIAGEHGQPGIGNRVEIHKRLFRVLRDMGYQGAVSCACPWVSSDGGPFDFAKESAKTLKYLQNLRAEVYAK
jgi:sugar phosphate isomerase/epimerase